MMRAKEYLKNLKRLDAVINQKLKELEDLKSRVSSIGGFDYNKDRVQTSMQPDAMYARIMNDMLDLDNEINAEIDEYTDEKHKIINQIQQLQDANEVEVLYRRYVNFETFDDIASNLGYSLRNVYTIHGRGLADFEQMFLSE